MSVQPLSDFMASNWFNVQPSSANYGDFFVDGMHERHQGMDSEQISQEDRELAALFTQAPRLRKALDMLLFATVDDDLKHGIGLTEAEEEARVYALEVIAACEVNA